MHGLYAEFGHDKRPLEHLVIQAFLLALGFRFFFPGLFFSTRSRGSDTSWPAYRLARFDLPSRTYTRRPGLRFLCRDESLGPFLFNSSLVSRPRLSAPRPLLSKTQLELQGELTTEVGDIDPTRTTPRPRRFLYPGFQALFFFLILFDTLLQRCFFSGHAVWLFFGFGNFLSSGRSRGLLWLDFHLFRCEKMREERRG